MTQERKNAIVDDIMALLIQLTDEETIQETSRKKPVEMLTIKECTQAVKGLSEHTLFVNWWHRTRSNTFVQVRANVAKSSLIRKSFSKFLKSDELF